MEYLNLLLEDSHVLYFFIPSDEVLVTLTDYNSVSGALKIKGDNYDINKM